MDKRMELLQKAVKEHGQAATARAIDYSPSAVNQAMHGKYNGSLENLLTRVEEVYGDTTVECPVMGRISLAKCAAERKKPCRSVSSYRIRIYNACKECENNG